MAQVLYGGTGELKREKGMYERSERVETFYIHHGPSDPVLAFPNPS